MSQKAGEPQADAGHGMNAKQRPLRGIANLAQRQHHVQRIQVLPCQAFDYSRQVRDRWGFKHAAHRQLNTQVCSAIGHHHRGAQRISP